MPVPSQINDGSFATAVQNGPPVWRRPFQDRGDTISFEYLAMFQQNAASYLPTNNVLNPISGYEIAQSISTPRGTAYLVEETEPRHVGCGLVEFQRTYAGLPRTRYEGSSVVYAQQFASGAGVEIQEIPLTLNARIKYEYFLTRPPVLYANRTYVLFSDYIFYGNDVYVPVEGGLEFLAEDTEITIYRGIFFQRKSILPMIPPFTTA